MEWWLAKAHHRTHKGLQLDFSAHSYLEAVYRDTAEKVVLRKATQVGVSEYLIAWAMAQCDQGRAVIWVFPTDVLRGQFVADRFDASVGLTGYYSRLAQKAGAARKRKDGADAVTYKQFGSVGMALVGSNTPVSFVSFAADCAIVDEVDRCDQDNLVMLPDRMRHSPHKQERRVGNPTVSGTGIDALYAESDRKRWHVRCDGCGDRQPLDWFQNVVREEVEGEYTLRASPIDFMCRACAKPIDRLRAGEWVAEYPDRAVSGYHISQLFSGSVSLETIHADFVRGQANETERQRFHNSVLGEPFTSAGAKLTSGLLDRCVGDYAQATNGDACFVGVDVGSLNHAVVIDGQSRVIRAFTCRTFEELDWIMAAYCPFVVIDALPETREARHFAERHRGKVLLCTFVKSDQVPDFKVDYDAMTVKADRTQTLDDSHAALLTRTARLPRDAASIPDFYAQMCAPTRVFDAHRQAFRWIEGSEPDHYRHAYNYAWLARSVRGRTGVSFVSSFGRGVSVG